MEKIHNLFMKLGELIMKKTIIITLLITILVGILFAGVFYQKHLHKMSVIEYETKIEDLNNLIDEYETKIEDLNRKHKATVDGYEYLLARDEYDYSIELAYNR